MGWLTSKSDPYASRKESIIAEGLRWTCLTCSISETMVGLSWILQSEECDIAIVDEWLWFGFRISQID